MKRPPQQPPRVDPERLARIRQRVLVTIAASSLAATGCDRTPDHTLNQPVRSPPETSPREINVPATPPRVLPDSATPAGPTNVPAPRVVVDAGAPLELNTNRPEPRRPMPLPTVNPPAPVIPRMPPGNG